jgi:XTP/dITP diphosphohydrolase
LLAHLPVTVLAADEVAGLPDVTETGTTFADNAVLKAVALAQASGRLALADDSGIEVDALGGAPGVYSARYAGPGADDAANRQKLLAALAGVPAAERAGRFRCAIALARPEGLLTVVEAAWEGTVAAAERGSGGFGYDSVFVPAGGDLTAAELAPEQKNAVSHRAQALRKMVRWLEEWLGGAAARRAAAGGSDADRTH